MRRKIAHAGIILTGLLVLTSCAASANPMANTAGGPIAGFWDGLWHGIISVIALIISLFNENVSIYEVHNNGAWYNFGFLWGAGAFFGGGAAATVKAKQ